jgi:hypothetical protein
MVEMDALEIIRVPRAPGGYLIPHSLATKNVAVKEERTHINFARAFFNRPGLLVSVAGVLTGYVPVDKLHEKLKQKRQQ